MRKYRLLKFIMILSAGLFFSCGQDEHEPYDHPFIHIMYNDASTVEVSQGADYTATYNIYLSSAPLKQNLEVTFDIVAGGGLVEGVDYEMVTKSRTLVFLPNIYDMPVRVHWKPHVLDENKDNTLKIVLVSNNMGFTMGLPGPSQNQKTLTIKKN